QPLAEKAMEAVRSGAIKIVPERFEKVFFHWMENIEDWCISRQLWWGHRVPAWHGPNGEIYVGKTPPKGDQWTADEDVLDTWFSSGLWPFSTLGWNQATPDMARFYPTQVMETGYDILFFWVARMIMMGLWFTDKPPFDTVYLHGLVRDSQGRKISKTLGNTVDPVELIDQYGADPLRFTLITSGTPGNDVNLDPNRVESEWKFINKVWQMTNFVTSNLNDGAPASGVPTAAALDLPSRWLLSRLNRLIASVQRLFDIYQFGEAGRQIRSFLWDEFADWYIEISKYPLYGTDIDAKQNAQRVLVYTLETCLRLMHPFMPYFTEDLWRYLPSGNKPLIISAWAQADETYIDDRAEAEMDVLMDMVRGIRTTRIEYNVDPSKRITAVVAPGSHRTNIQQYSYLFARLCNVAELQMLEGSVPEDSASVIVSDVTIYLPLKGMIDYNAEIERLGKELSKLQEQIGKGEATLSNEQFTARARPDVVQRERDKLAELQASAAQLDSRLTDLSTKI
ncbi:MAG: class I tRNA ligase family protein, partial [Armatimonadetes bacterium]|nr:class I tRNA ligase family protein [Anaerolineae bacterium]